MPPVVLSCGRLSLSPMGCLRISSLLASRALGRHRNLTRGTTASRAPTAATGCNSWRPALTCSACLDHGFLVGDVCPRLTGMPASMLDAASPSTASSKRRCCPPELASHVTAYSRQIPRVDLFDAKNYCPSGAYLPFAIASLTAALKVVNQLAVSLLHCGHAHKQLRQFDWNNAALLSPTAGSLFTSYSVCAKICYIVKEKVTPLL